MLLSERIRQLFANPIRSGSIHISKVGRCSIPLLSHVPICYIVTTDTLDGISRMFPLLASKITHLCSQTYVVRASFPQVDCLEVYTHLATLYLLHCRRGTPCLVLQHDALVPDDILQVHARRFGEIDAFLKRMPEGCVFSLGSIGRLEGVTDATRHFFKFSHEVVSFHAMVLCKSFFQCLLKSEVALWDRNMKMEDVVSHTGTDVYSYYVAALTRQPGRQMSVNAFVRYILSTRRGWDFMFFACRNPTLSSLSILVGWIVVLTAVWVLFHD